jgi:hypothetical protein
MTKLGRSTIVLCVVFGALVLAATAQAQTRPPIAEQLAKTYGLDSYGQIDAIRYTFSAELPGVNLSRSWVWQPKTGQISYEGKDKEVKPAKVTYVQSRLDGEPDNVKNEIDPAFYNDNYWLLLPLHVYWDSNADVQDKGAQKLPLGSGSAKQVVVKYPSEGGVSPGDTWELYTGQDNRIANGVSPGRHDEAEHRHRNLDGLPESRPSADLDGTQRDGGQQAGAHRLVECVGQAGGLGQMGECAVRCRSDLNVTVTSVVLPTI